MASSHSPSSSQDPATPNPPLLLAAPPPTTSTAVSRRLPPPCWSHDETVALIDAYRDKWYSLRRGNLRASHWQEVADDVAARCPLPSGNPQKTSIQCRHKMEKLRKRYRAEIQRAATTPKGHRYCSSWVHFKRMDSMEKGSASSDPAVDPINPDEEEDDEGDDENPDDLLLYPRGIKQAIPLNNRFYGSDSNGIGGVGAGNNNGFRIKIPGRGNSAAAPPPQPPSGLNMYNDRGFDDYPPPTNPNYGSSKGSRDGYMKGGFGIGKERSGGLKRREAVVSGNNGNPVEEMVAAIKMLGDGFVRIERMKMEMARELESMRMEMEMKRTEMILESQQRLVDSFSKAVLETKNKKTKRMPTPES